MTCIYGIKDNDEAMIDRYEIKGSERKIGGYVGIMKAAEHQKKS